MTETTALVCQEAAPSADALLSAAKKLKKWAGRDLGFLGVEDDDVQIVNCGDGVLCCEFSSNFCHYGVYITAENGEIVLDAGGRVHDRLIQELPEGYELPEDCEHLGFNLLVLARSSNWRWSMQ